MSDIQNNSENYDKIATKVATSIFGILILKWIVIFGLNRWARSLR